MKNAITGSGLGRFRGRSLVCGILMAAASACTFAAEAPSNTGRRFTSAESAAQALAEAAKTKDRAALKAILGPGSEDLQMSDQAQAEEELTSFAEAFQAGHRIVRESDARATLEVGTNNWPLPIPLAQKNGQWFFDTQAGKEEMINRRIGRNELSALETVRVYVDAQREYARIDHDADEVLEYAQKLQSTPGKKDGLYWPPELDGEISPLGPFVAEAQGYIKNTRENSGPRPFHGYYFKILT